jgi:hypothetical protein
VFEHCPAAFRQRSAAALRAARSGLKRRAAYDHLYLLEQKPRATVAHAHRGRSAANGTCVIYQFEKARFARTEGGVLGKVYADGQAGHQEQDCSRRAGASSRAVVGADGA